jgi:hypothetical protein
MFQLPQERPKTVKQKISLTLRGSKKLTLIWGEPFSPQPQGNGAEVKGSLPHKNVPSLEEAGKLWDSV